MHLSMLSLGGGGGQATHGVLIMRPVPRVRSLIIQDIPRMGNLT